VEGAFVAGLGVGRNHREEAHAFLTWRRMFASHSSPDSSPPSASNHPARPPARSVSQMRRAAAGSCDALPRKAARGWGRGPERR
jgi:hypothetical protein